MKKFFQNKIKLLISLTFLILFVFNTVAYSGLATKLAITSEAMFRPITDIRVTDIKLDSATNGAVESYSPKFNVDTTTTGFVLPNANSTITYKVKVTNYGNVNQTIYNFIKNSINSSNVNIKITDFTSVCADDSCSQKNSDFTIIHHNGDNTTDSNEKEILITFSTSAPSDQAINVIEKYDFRPIYNINYDANGGQNAPKSQIKIYKDNLTLTTDEPTRPTYKFLGWSTSSKSTTAEYKAGDSYNPGTNEEVKDIILYAVWKIDSYTLTINPNGGTWNNSTNKSTITQSYGSTYIIENPTKTGYTFTGWTLSGKGSLNGTTYTFGEGAATLTANYTANTYTITLDNKSATTAGTTAIYEKYGAGIYLDSALKNVMTTTTNKITVPAKTGYTFKGYYTKENGQGDRIINENGYITDKATNTTYIANTTLYAYYKDETKPTLTLTNSSNGNWTNKDVTITLNGADSGSGIREYQWKENGAWTTRAIAITNGVGSITYTVDRNLEIEFRTIDNAGNVSDTKTTYVRRDTITPKIELNGAASSSEINNNSVTIPIKITETASGINNSEFTTSDISVLINGTKVNPSTKTLTYNNVSNGIYSYTLTLSGITLNGKVTLEIAAGAVKDIATNSNSKTTLDPSITVSNIYTISLNGNGTPAIYEKYNTGIYLDSALTSAMTTSANPITKPIRSYTVSFNANSTGITIPSAITKSYSYSGYYTDATNGTQMINENGYITSSFTKTSYTSNGTLYAHWKAKPSVTIPAISKTGYTCSWNTSADGKGTTYNAGDVTDKLNTQTLYAVCKANSYTVSYNSNGGSGTMTNDTATYDSNFITKKNTFTKTGYTFNGWNEKADGTGTVWGLTTSGVYESGKTWKWTYTKNITLYTQWKANTNTKYVVKHYKQKLDGTYPSEADDTDNLTGTADSSVSPAIKSYAGFTAPSVQTVTISADGSTVVTYKYTRNKYTFTLGSTTGITTTGSTASGSYYYGSTITLKASANTGYIFTGWTSSNTSLVGNQTTANTTFTMPAGNITMTPSVTVNSYTVTYDATTNGGSTAKQTASTKYKSLVDLTKKAEKSGYEFVGWNTNKDATSALSSYEMPAKNVTLYAIYKKTLTATFNYYNSKSETRSVTIYNNATSGSITSPAALGTPNGYTFRHYSTSNVANAAKTIDANSAVVLTSNQTYYASYQKNVTAKIYYSTLTANDYIYSGASQTSVDVTAVKYLGYTGVEVDSTYTVPTAVTSSTGGASAEKYIGVSNKVSDATVITPTTANTSYYAVYTESITFHYYNGTAHTKTTLTRRMLSNGSSYSNSLSGSEPVVGNYDGASKTAWSYDPNHYESSYIRTSLATGTNNLYAIYTKSVTSTFNYYDGSKAATTTVSSNKYYVSKDSGINTFNTNITIPDAAKANRGSYTYRGISTSNAANASVVTPTTANTTYYSSYTYAITANFTANGGTGTAPSSAAGTGYMNYSGSKIGISVTMPSNTFTRNGYTFGGWYDSVVNKTYTAGTSVTVDSSRNFNATWNVVTYTIKYNLNGGTVSATNPTSYKATDADITLNNPTKQGYTFTGWTGTGLSEASKAVTIKSGSYGNREYTANYSINQYYYDVNPDSGIKSFDITIDGKTSTGLTDYNQKHNYGTEATITNVVAKPGYTYTGYKVTGSMTTLTGSTNSNIKTKLGAGNGYIALTSNAKTLKFDAQTLASIKYSTTPQALVFEGASNGTGSYSYAITAGNTNGYFNINGTTITTSDKVVPPVGTYKLTVQAIDNTSKVTATADITIVIEKAGSTNPTLTAYSGTYDGQSHTISVSGGSGGTIHYSTDQKTWSTTKPTRTAQGTTTVYVKVVGDSNHTDTGVISSTITIKPATITYTASSYEGFYDGNSHTISVSVTKPTSGATITYSLTENGTYSATKPTVTNATTTPVTVYFKISASNYNIVSSKATITINKTNSVSPKLTAYSGTYDGKPHTIGVTGGSGGTIKYSTDQKTWSTTKPTRTDATTTPVTVYVKVFGDGNHKDTSIISSTITINKKTDVITMSSISTNYTGQKVEATATAESKTTITYTYYNGTTCSGTALSSAPVNVGDYSVKATSTGNNNYKSNSACATIKISNTNNPTTVSAVAGLKYGSTGNLVTTSNVQGTIYYSIGTELTSSNYKTSGSTSIPTASGKNAGTYKVYYYVDATGTNFESTKGGPVSVTIGKALGSISYATKSVTKDYGNASFVNTLTKTGDGTITSYLSSNTGVATIDASGRVTIIAAGTTTITAKVTDGTNYTYSTKTATYTLVVNKIENTAKVSPVTGIIYGEEKSMVSTTGVQGTIYYSVGTVLTESNYLSAGSVTIPTSKGRNAGTYNIYYYVTGNSNYKVVSNNSSNPVAVVIGKKQDVVSITEKSATYTGSAIGANTATATSGTGITYTYYSSQDCSGTALSEAPINKGNYSVKATSAGNSNYTSGSKCVKHTIDFGTPTISLGDTTKTYTGSPITSVGAIGKNPNGSSVSLNYTYTYYNGTTCSGTAISAPVNYNANNYSVKATSAATSNLKSATSNCAKLTIGKVPAANPTLTAYSGTYDGQSHTISVSGGFGGTIQYSTDNKTWSTTKPTRTNVGTTTVYVKVVGDGNHTDTNPISSTITITAQQLPAPKFFYSDISTAGIVTWGNVSNATKYQISIDGTNWTDATSGVDYLSKIIAATGTRTVYVRAVGEGNYSTSKNATASKSVYTVTVNSNSTTMGTVDTSSYNVISGATYSASSNKLLFIGTTTGSTTKTLKTVTATAKSNYTFNNWSSVSGSITSNVTLTANFNSSEFTISLNPNGGTGGTSAIYERYNKGIYLDSGTNSKQMTTSANAITKPTKEPYTISFNANNTGATVPSNYSFSPVFNGYYTATTSNGTQMIDNRGYITNNLTSTKYTSNTTLYAQWNHYYTLPSLSKGGNTCKWAIGSASGTKYNSGTSLFINDNKVFYAVCTPNKYKVKFEPNGGTSSATEMDVTYDSPYGTLPTVTRSASKVNDITINYVFEGWYDSNGTKITETSIVETPSDHTLYAHWLSSPNIKGGTAESWSSTAVTISLNIPSTSDTGTVSYQYYLSETNELPESATWIDITSADGSVSISKNGEFYIFYKATSSAGVSITSNYNKLQIDTQTPSTSITAYQAGTTTTVASNKWINKNLEFKMGALNVGPSSGSIYYCIGDNCTPNTLISPNTAIPTDLTNTKTGIYKVRYKAVSNAGLSSSIGEYVAKVDKTAPTMKAVVKSLKDNSTLANLTNSSTTYIDSTWRSYGYSINLNGTTDSQSGISSIERFTNANNLKRADADYKANLHKGVITDTKTFSESGDGAKYAKFVATDNAGNTTTFTVEVLIDKTAPTVGVNIYKAKDASTKTGSVICALPTSLSNGCKDAFPWTSYGYYFDFSPSSDELSGIDYYTMRYTAGGKSSVDTSSYEERNVHSAYTTVTSSGARRLEFTATDKAGNTSTVEAKNVYIDMDDPNLVIKLYKADSSGNKTGSVLKTITDNNTAINSWTNYRHYFDLSGSSDSLSGIEKITMQINDSCIVTTGNTATGTSDLKTTYTITSTKHQVVGSSGNRYARFTITDKVGNTSVKNVRIYIDLDAPTLNSASLSPQFQSSTTIKYTCSDKTSGFASFGTKTLSKTYTKNVTSSNSPVKIQCKDTAGNTSSGTRTYTWSANSDKCGTTTEDVYSNGYYCDAGNAASANSSACISYATNTGKTTKYVNKRCMYYCNAKTGTTTVAKTCWHQ